MWVIELGDSGSIFTNPVCPITKSLWMHARASDALIDGEIG